MRRLIVIAGLILASCTRPAVPAQVGLAHELEGFVAEAPQTCVPISPNQNLRVIDARTLAYGYTTVVYVNHLGADCPALSPYNSVIIDAQGGQYCRGDRVRGLEPHAGIPGPWCNLGDWTTYRKK
jgi:hypothetical protein